MNLDLITNYLLHYGYIIITLCLFCGIVGIPAPEETFMVVVGVLIANHHLNLSLSLLSAFIGIFFGMIVAYMIGRKMGPAFIKKFGKYMFITPKKWEYVSRQFHRYGRLTIVFAYFFPGIRQISPYLAGTTRYPLVPYILLATIGNAIWCVVFIFGGYHVGNHIPLKFLAWIPVFYILVFAFFYLKRKMKKRTA
ncbi:DedA family protein [Fictibacillus barbaricus]|uniref:Membrane protein DedA with SNARE-associated domain n=1 Tax=Fictibacillus barbaricus TaxID=182136 RepID=A0ABU1TWB9_9BACL|nr:DedA family protein [Fictibacillus barbaricus]MDR7071469.1 membrane protein DedA with SNARE-associated domain [Fictibacillus barbaricus]